MTGTATIHDGGDHLRVTLSNPGRRNALSPAIYDGILAALDQAGDDARFGAVILTGADGYFCAGGDLNALAERAALTQSDRAARIGALHGVVRAMRACPRPVIAAIEGGAAGAGLSLVLACDLIVAARDAVFSAAYVRAGLVPDGGLTASLARALPAQMAARMCLTGDPVDAVRLAELGVVGDLVQPGTALAEAEALAARLASGPPHAQAAIKRLLGSARDASFEQQLDAEQAAMAAALGHPEAGVGITARLTRQTPHFDRVAAPLQDDTP